jgi:hypothetical protein
VRGGVYYYKVNYGKNPLEGEHGDEEIGYVECSKVIPLGGKRPKPIPGKTVEKAVPIQIQQPQTEPVKTVKKPGRPKKNVDTNVQVSAPTDSAERFEYMVENMNMDNPEDLKRVLNNWGEDGWELCWFEPERSIFGSYKARAIFKRKRG